MPSTDHNQELLQFFKALADANRLKIIGLLAQNEFSVEELAEMLGLRASTVSHHLARLGQAGLVSARAESYYNLYRLEQQALESMARRLLSEDTLPAAADGIDLDAYDRKVITNFTLPDGRLKALPAQQKKLEAVLRYVLAEFEPGVRYSEKEINEMLARYHDDSASLRRALVGFKLMAREGGGGAYWRIDQTAAS